MTVKLTPSAKALKLAVKDARTTLKACDKIPVLGKIAIRVWGFEYVRSLLSIRIDETIPTMTACGIVDTAGRPFVNKVPANGPFDFVQTSNNLRFFARMCAKSYNTNCEGTSDDKTAIHNLNTLIRSLDQRGWTPYAMTLIISEVLGLNATDAQKLLLIKSNSNREENEKSVLMECAQDETRTPYEWLEIFDYWIANGSRTVPAPYQPKDSDVPVSYSNRAVYA